MQSALTRLHVIEKNLPTLGLAKCVCLFQGLPFCRGWTTESEKWGQIYFHDLIATAKINLSPLPQKERSTKAANKRVEYDEKELRHKTRLGIRQKLEDLMAWNDIEEISEAIQNLILNAHALGPTLSYRAIGSPRHNFQISENVARMFEKESLRMIKKDPGDEIDTPNILR